jgi:hypothetical protein
MHPSGDKLGVFLSYSRHDMAAADALVTALEARGFEVLIDRRDLPYGEEWQQELAELVRRCDTVLWLVSAASIDSRMVRWELGEIGRLSKRLVPVQIERVDPITLPVALGKIQLLPAVDAFSLERHLSSLVDTLNTDRAWVKEHTRLADRARQWIARGRARAFLLRGALLREAQAWSSRRTLGSLRANSEVLELVLASRRAAAWRKGWMALAVVALFAVYVGV